jgi:predicted DNA-binding transcriptional regulator AlpA
MLEAGRGVRSALARQREKEPVMSVTAVQQAPQAVLYKIPEVMEMLRMSRGALYNEIKAGRLRKVKRGRSVFVTSAAIAADIELLEQEAEAAL